MRDGRAGGRRARLNAEYHARGIPAGDSERSAGHTREVGRGSRQDVPGSGPINPQIGEHRDAIGRLLTPGAVQCCIRGGAKGDGDDAVEITQDAAARVLNGDPHGGRDRGPGDRIGRLRQKYQLRRGQDCFEIRFVFTVTAERDPGARGPGLVHGPGVPVIAGVVRKASRGRRCDFAVADGWAHGVRDVAERDADRLEFAFQAHQVARIRIADLRPKQDGTLGRDPTGADLRRAINAELRQAGWIRRGMLRNHDGERDRNPDDVIIPAFRYELDRVVVGPHRQSTGPEHDRDRCRQRVTHAGQREPTAPSRNSRVPRPSRPSVSSDGESRRARLGGASGRGLFQGRRGHGEFPRGTRLYQVSQLASPRKQADAEDGRAAHDYTNPFHSRCDHANGAPRIGPRPESCRTSLRPDQGQRNQPVASVMPRDSVARAQQGWAGGTVLGTPAVQYIGGKHL